MYSLSLSASDDKDEPNREVVDEPRREGVEREGVDEPSSRSRRSLDVSGLPRRTAASTWSIVF